MRNPYRSTTLGYQSLPRRNSHGNGSSDSGSTTPRPRPLESPSIEDEDDSVMDWFCDRFEWVIVTLARIYLYDRTSSLLKLSPALLLLTLLMFAVQSRPDWNPVLRDEVTKILEEYDPHGTLLAASTSQAQQFQLFAPIILWMLPAGRRFMLFWRNTNYHGTNGSFRQNKTFREALWTFAFVTLAIGLAAMGSLEELAGS